MSADPLILALEADIATLDDGWRLPWATFPSGPSVWDDARVRELLATDGERRLTLAGQLLVHERATLRGIGLHIVAEARLAPLAPLAREALGDGTWKVRALAARAIGVLRDIEALELLLDTVDAEHSEAKKAIVQALAALADTRAIPLLTRWVGRAGEDDELRRLACHALGEIEDAAAMPVLSRVLADETVALHVRIAAAEAVARIPDSQARALLLEHLRSTRGRLQGAVARGLARTAGAEALPCLLPLCGPGGEASVKGYTLEAIHLVAPHDATRLGRDLLRDPEAAVRREVAMGIGRGGIRGLLDDLGPLLEDRDAQVRSAAVWAAARLNGREPGRGESSPDPEEPDRGARKEALARDEGEA